MTMPALSPCPSWCAEHDVQPEGVTHLRYTLNDQALGLVELHSAFDTPPAAAVDLHEDLESLGPEQLRRLAHGLLEAAELLEGDAAVSRRR